MAFDEYKKLADEGDPEAQYELGMCYYDGSEIEQDHCEAVKWFRKSAEQNNTSGKSMLGLCYFAGEGVEHNSIEAVKWLKEAAEC